MEHMGKRGVVDKVSVESADTKRWMQRVREFASMGFHIAAEWRDVVVALTLYWLTFLIAKRSSA